MAVNMRIGVAQGITPYDGPSIFRRQCVQCADESPTCPPKCAEGEKCAFTAQTCSECTQAKCIKAPDAAQVSGSSGGGGPAIGPIVGGVIGGLVVISVITYFVWRYCIKNKRGEYEEDWQSEGQPKEGTVNDADGVRQSRRQSAQSVHSLASTVLTRASNIIQIAYIPGVTNRAAPNSPGVLVPPVPPIPLALSENGSPSPYGDQHFFVPGNLRDSTYSGISNYTDRTSYARTSYAPRSSVASTIYGKNAVVGPVQKGTLLKPSIVSVKSKPNSGPNTPPVPAVDYEKYEQPPPSPAFSIGATFFKNASASTATTVRPQVVRVGSAPKVVEVKSASDSSPASVTEEEPSEPAKAAPDAQSGETRTARDSTAVTIIDDTPALDQGPFSDPPARSSTRQSSSDLSTVIEEATRRAAETRKSDAGSSLNRARSPFSDEHAVKE